MLWRDDPPTTLHWVVTLSQACEKKHRTPRFPAPPCACFCVCPGAGIHPSQQRVRGGAGKRGVTPRRTSASDTTLPGPKGGWKFWRSRSLRRRRDCCARTPAFRRRRSLRGSSPGIPCTRPTARPDCRGGRAPWRSPSAPGPRTSIRRVDDDFHARRSNGHGWHRPGGRGRHRRCRCPIPSCPAPTRSVSHPCAALSPRCQAIIRRAASPTRFVIIEFAAPPGPQAPRAA